MRGFFSDEERRKFEKDKEFRLEALKRLIPDTSWYGESYHDTKSVNNIDVLAEMSYIIMEEMFRNCSVPEGNKGNGSYEEIARSKRNVLRDLISDACDNNVFFDLVLEYIIYVSDDLSESEKAKLRQALENE